MWRQLRGAYEIDRLIFVPRFPSMDGYTFDQADSMEEALRVLPGDCHRVFLEPTGKKNISEIPRTGHIALILGDTNSHNLMHADEDETYHIASPGSADLYGINAAAIALAIEFGQ